MNQSFSEIQKALSQWWAQNQKPVFDPAEPKIALHHPTFDWQEIAVFVEQMLSTNVTMNRKVAEFEQSFSDQFGYGGSVSCNSGSSANLLMFTAITSPLNDNRLNPGDEVILPALTWSTSLWPILQRGLTPVFVDSDPHTLNMDPQSIVDAISSKTRAILAVPIYGNPCDMDALEDICKKHSLMLLEDCCESMGATYNGKPVGSFGDISSFSFYFSHHITTMEGGICVVNDRSMVDMLKIQRAHGWLRDVEDRKKWLKEDISYDERFLFVGEGYNLRLTEPQAVMGLLQLQKLEKFVALRRKNAAYLISKLGGYEPLLTTQRTTKNSEHSWFGLPILIEPTANFTRRQICDHLNAHGVETRPIVAGNLVRHPWTSQYQFRTAGQLKGADNVMDYGFSLPCHQSLTTPALDYMISVLKQFLGDRGYGK